MLLEYRLRLEQRGCAASKAVRASCGRRSGWHIAAFDQQPVVSFIQKQQGFLVPLRTPPARFWSKSWSNCEPGPVVISGKVLSLLFIDDSC